MIDLDVPRDSRSNILQLWILVMTFVLSKENYIGES